MDELNMLRKKVRDLEKDNRLFKETEKNLHATNQQLQVSGQQLKSKQETLIRTQRIARIGSWEWDVATDTVTWSDELFHIFRLNPENGTVSYADHPKIYAPESMQRLDTAVKHTLKTGEPYEIDLEIIRTDGTNAFCTARGYAEKNEEEKVVRLFGSFQDITERKNAEEELKKSEERLRTVIDNSPFPIAVVDEKDNHIQYWSKSAIQLFGHSPETSEEWYELAYPNPEYRQNVVERWKPFLEIAQNTTDSVNTGEYEIHCKNGSVKICELYAQFIPGSLIVTLNDITERKNTEKHLKKIEWLLQNKKEKTEIRIPDYGDLTAINQNRTILDSVGKEVLNGIVIDYLSLLDTCAAVYEKNGDYAVGIFSSEWCQFMDCSSRALCKTKNNKKALESGKWLCHESCWADASNQSIQTNKPVDIECSGGLHIYAIPIMANNEVIGSINFGYGNPPTDKDKLKEIAANYNVSVDKLEKLAQSYETRPAFIIDVAKEKLETSAKLIGNIVERKQLEVNYQRNQKRYEKAQTLGHVGNWEYDPVSENFWASDEAKRIYGYDLSLENLSTEIVESCIPERERVHQALLDLLKYNKKYDLIFDIITYDKGIRKTIHSIAELERDAQGNPLKIAGVINDISIQKKAEDNLKALNQQLIANEQQLRAANQQLQANEQQLKAANQQLRASEQQLLASNQQLQANEQQLRAANQQLQASEQQMKAANRQLEASEKELVDANKKLLLAKEQVERSEKYLENIIENIADPIFVKNEKSKILIVNDAFCQLFGLNKENIIGKDLAEDVSSEERESFLRIDKMVLNDGKENINEESLTVHGGQTKIISTKKTRFIDEKGRKFLVGIIRDITERKQSEIELLKAKEKAEESERKYKILTSILEYSQDFIGLSTPDQKAFYINPAGQKMLGIESNEMVNKTRIQDYFFPEDLTFVNNTILPTLMQEGRWAGEFRFKHFKTNEPVHVFYDLFLTADPITKDVINFSTISRDITAQKKVEKELINAKEKAEESDRLKSAFLANMSHEIRTPMNGILGFTNLLKEPGLTGKQQKEYVEIIQKSGDRMLNTVNDIIDISRIESGIVELLVTEVNITEQLKYLHTFFKPEAAKNGTQLVIKNEINNQDFRINTDPEKLNSILTNLIKNAIKFTSQGSIEIGYSLKIEDEQNYVEFYVKDTGIGIQKDRQTAIFDRFVQADIEDKHAKQGSGLGLAISKAYAEMLGGKMWLDSKPGLGSTFYFTIKYHSQTDLKLNRKNDGQFFNEDIISEKLKILVTEDDETSDMLISIMLQETSREILHVKNGLEAIEFCRNNPDIDLILMDIKMPVLGGYETTRQIRQFNKDVIIIAQTAYGLRGEREKAIEAGCNDYITKPINKTELLLLIRKYFN